jgi:RNA recognition motif-containing protein
LPRPRFSPGCKPQGICISKNLFVGNLSFTVTADDLLEAFGEHGRVTRAQIVSDRDTGRSRGFGFVEMSDGGDEAMAALNGAELKGRKLNVNEAKPREERPRPDRSYGARV